MAALERFVAAQEDVYEDALNEIRGGHKYGHWMWYIFPQLVGLGTSDSAKLYGIKDLTEAKAYLDHEVLGNRLREITTELLYLNTEHIDEVFGYPDTLKLFSCMTLFHQALIDDDLFMQVLKRFYNGEQDPNTLRILGIKP